MFRASIYCRGILPRVYTYPFDSLVFAFCFAIVATDFLGDLSIMDILS
jgi:hypothetical protein